MKCESKKETIHFLQGGIFSLSLCGNFRSPIRIYQSLNIFSEVTKQNVALIFEIFRQNKTFLTLPVLIDFHYEINVCCFNQNLEISLSSCLRNKFILQKLSGLWYFLVYTIVCVKYSSYKNQVNFDISKFILPLIIYHTIPFSKPHR